MLVMKRDLNSLKCLHVEISDLKNHHANYLQVTLQDNPIFSPIKLPLFTVM